MVTVTMKELLEAGVHFGHQVRRWNPKMKEYIFGERNGIYIIDLQKTQKMFREALQYVTNMVAEDRGKTVLFVGTKRQAQDAVREEAERCGQYYINNRWLGGLLTNYETVKKSINKLKEIETMREDGRFEMLPGAYFIPLNEALLEFEEVHGIRDELEQIFPERYRDSFRFLTDWSDGGYAFGRIDSPSQGEIVHRCIHAPWLLAYHDLADLLKTSIACYRQGVMRSGSDPPDFRAYYELAARMNPGLENWR